MHCPCDLSPRVSTTLPNSFQRIQYLVCMIGNEAKLLLQNTLAQFGVSGSECDIAYLVTLFISFFLRLNCLLNELLTMAQLTSWRDPAVDYQVSCAAKHQSHTRKRVKMPKLIHQCSNQPTSFAESLNFSLSVRMFKPWKTAQQTYESLTGFLWDFSPSPLISPSS